MHTCVCRQDMVWNLQTWPLDLVDWPTHNSHRMDLRFDPNYPNLGSTSWENAGVYPANERVQGRWNGDPHDLDGGSGFTEMDAGAWLLPYWLARAFQLIGPA